ncbi:CPBP family intramembrane glutamic endopeptidase [Desulfosporosinus nitroreducens]|uniref:CPBP family intramembrane metalloprotease n=1 Tax=Desulfosporosinus nitroreducens TaxID=2018668 RepID=A0ABT8QNV9_9FIRM|nr:type II CAAX endopeptidase family protein [Desulfosporosinus nitroreducens]MCO1599913.1 CPBP family intramembrane metalloprotease [Desulfosporosinus nitroreducens]MDO0823044.1 CPBP family intramembrane metalloprotease [Desulfosporosinus nitroreducens]
MEKTDMNLDNIELPPRGRRLNWVDLALVLGGVVGIYIILSFGTFWLLEQWPHERVLMYLNAFMTQVSFALLIWTLKKARHWTWADFGWQGVPVRMIISRVLGLYALTWVVNICYAIALFNYGFTPPETDVYSKLLGQVSWYTLILNLLLAGVLAPIVEETLFRGVIFGSLQAYFGKWTAAVISAAIFSALHFQAYGFLPRFVLGMILVYLYDKYKSLYPSMGLHALNNIVATLIAASVLIE